VATTTGRRRRRWLLIAIAAVILLLVILGALSGLYVDLLWFREVHFSSVFWTIFWSKLTLGAIFGIAFFVLLLANLLIARRLTPRFRVFSPEQEAVERYRAAIEPYANIILPLFAAVIALFVGIAVSGQWQTFLLWRSAGGVHFPAGHLDPVFHRDPTYYIFTLPFQQFVQGWLFDALVAVTVLTAIAHYLNGGIRVQAAGERVTPQVKAHLSVLLGLIVLVKAWGYYLGKFNLLVSSRGGFTGADFTDVHAQLPALRLLVFIAIACAILFLVNIRFRGWALPVIGIGLLAIVSIVVGGIVPGIVQRFQVQPQLFQKERPYIVDNIAATRYAFGLSNIEPVTTTPTSDITADQVASNLGTVQNIRLWSPSILRQTYDSLQRIQPYYEFSDVDVDRYLVQSNGKYNQRVVMLSAREVSQIGIPGNQTWQNTHLVYTHGYGVVASVANAVTSDGAPQFLLQNIPVQQGAGSTFPAPSGTGAQVYYCEQACTEQPYVVVNTKQKELNYQDPTSQQTNQTQYAGQGGIPVGSFWRRLVFAYRYRDFNLLISKLIDSDSRIMINRDIRTRISKAAPFLKYDGDPYAAVVNGRLVYIQDAYTSTSLYPYSQRQSLGAATNGVLSGTTNYMRNSVKAIVDAYNGTVTFYVVDPSDPLIQVWEKAFPHLFTTAIPPTIVRSHFRYPEGLFQTQATVFGTYHVTDPQTFFQKGRQWNVPGQLSTTPSGAGAPIGNMQPYYVLLKLPDQTSPKEQFVLFVPFTPPSRGNMVAYMAAGSDGYGFPGQQYGKLAVYQFPSGENIDGPQQVRNFINQDPNVSSQLTLLSQHGSNVLFGDLLIVPIEDGFLYVQPIFVISSSANPIPQLKRVVVVHGGNVTIGTSLQDALDTSFGITPPPTSPGQPPPTQPGNATVQQLLAQAVQHFQAADAALKNGDLATYQSEIRQGEALVQEAQSLAARQRGGVTASPTPTPSASPSG
jgi:hypothetical protein